MAPRNFSLADLVPQYDTFTDLDGQVYPIKGTESFSAEDFAALNRFRSDMAALQAHKPKEDDLDAMAKQVAAMQQTLNGFIGMVLPTLPADRIAAMDLGHKLNFLQWWQELQAEKNPPPNRAARRASQSNRRPSSRSSSRSIA